MEQPHGFVANEEYGKVCRLQVTLWPDRFGSAIQKFGLRRFQNGHLVFFCIHYEKYILLVVYLNDIVII